MLYRLTTYAVSVPSQMANAAIGTTIALRPTSRSTGLWKHMTSWHGQNESAESVGKWTGEFYCEADAEPLARYRKGGYHPTHLGDTFKEGRYKIMHKLGWGGYATVWLARDLM